MRKFKSAMLALSILLSLVIAMGCQPIKTITPGTYTVKFTSPTAAKGISKAISGGNLGTTDSFIFSINNVSGGSNFWFNNSAVSVAGQAVPFHLSETGNTSQILDVTCGSTETSLVAEPLGGLVSGTYDEALLQILTGANSGTDVGPRFSIDNGASSTLYGGAGIAGEKPLYLNDKSLQSLTGGTAYILFTLPSNSGLSGANSAFISLDSLGSYKAGDTDATDILNAKASFLDQIHTALNLGTDTSYDDYWTAFYERYCMGSDNGGQLGGQIAGLFMLEVITIDKAFDFGDGSASMALTVTYDTSAPAGTSYYTEMADTSGYPAPASEYLRVVGTPPLKFAASLLLQ